MSFFSDSIASNSNSNNRSTSKETNSTPHLLNENAMLVMEFLDVKSLIRCAQTHTEWKTLSSKPSLWNRLCQKDFHSVGGYKKDYQSCWTLEKDKNLINLKLYVAFLDEIYMACSSAMFLVICFIVFPLACMSSLWSFSRSLSLLHVLICPFVLYLFTKAALFLTLLTGSSSLGQCIWYLDKKKVLQCIFWNSSCLVNHLLLLGMFCMAEVIPMSFHMYHFHTKSAEWTRMAWILLCLLAYVCFSVYTVHYTTKYAHKQHLIASWVSIVLASAMFYGNFGHFLMIAPLGLVYMWQLRGAAFSMKRISHGFCTGIHFWGIDYCRIYYRQGFLPVLSFGLFLININMKTNERITYWIMCIDFFGWVFFGPIIMKLKQIQNLLKREIPFHSIQ